MIPLDSILVRNHQWCVNEIILENGGKKMSVYQNAICKQGVILSLPQPTHALERYSNLGQRKGSTEWKVCIISLQAFSVLKLSKFQNGQLKQNTNTLSSLTRNGQRG